MNGIRKCAIGFSVLSCLMLTTLHGLDSNEKTKIKGLITGRTGDALIVKTADSSVTVVLTDDTKVQKPKGLGLRKTQMSFTALIPGLKVSVEGVHDEKGQLVAEPSISPGRI